MRNETVSISAGSATLHRSRPQTSFERARIHSRRVRWMKRAIPLAVLLLVVLFAGWAWLGSLGNLPVDVAATTIEDGRIVMSSPTLNGFTRDNLPYSMSAEQASRDIADPGVIRLEKITARLPIDPQNWVEIEAGSGLFDSDRSSLDIDSPMKVTTSHGLVAEFLSARLDMTDGTIVSEDPVRVALDGSTLSAERLHVSERGRVIILEDTVRMTIVGGLDGWGKNHVD